MLRNNRYRLCIDDEFVGMFTSMAEVFAGIDAAFGKLQDQYASSIVFQVEDFGRFSDEQPDRIIYECMSAGIWYATCENVAAFESYIQIAGWWKSAEDHDFGRVLDYLHDIDDFLLRLTPAERDEIMDFEWPEMFAWWDDKWYAESQPMTIRGYALSHAQARYVWLQLIQLREFFDD